MRSLALVLALLGLSPDASCGYTLGPRLVDPLGVSNDGLGYSVAGFPTTNGGALAAAGTVGTYVAIARSTPGTNALSIDQRVQSGIADDSFGLSVALGGNSGELLAVGAPADDSFGLNTGRVYLFRRQPSTGLYAPLTTLNPPNPSLTGNYGTSVALTTDGSRLLVGEPKAQQAGIEMGAIHVYDLTGPVIGAPTTLYSDLGAGGRFGQYVAMAGNRVVVGAPLADDPTLIVDTGAVRILTLTGNSLAYDGPALFADDRASGDRLGLSVAVDGDLLVAGAANDDKPAGGEVGSAYVFRRGSNWQQEAKLRSSVPQAQERFGQSVAIHGSEIVVGAYCLNAAGCTGPGAVDVYRYDGAAWPHQERLVPADAANFGHAVSYAGDNRIVVGAFASDATFVDQGAVYAAAQANALFSNGFD